MTIYDILKQTPFTEISEKIQKFYGNKDIDKFAELYNKLLSITSDHTDKKFTVYISAFRISDSDEDEYIEHFDENDTSLHYDVRGNYDDQDQVYSIAACDYSDFLQYNIDANTLKNYSYSTILAHCFWEITAYGFDRE
ncbi:MAG: hypothetical protein K6F71_13785 [Ruminococcus sp.]|uniref:DUF6557 family protein n=1 Tax=Ruminococcus sp. TaxID=41978 RepID=UPI0025FAEDD3|nr:DUF6557 family protein [Ruminococcus sp.]MCR5541873.1 hypothetical protein [Ruminococcus sp.]